jgi:hypothetical protein
MLGWKNYGNGHVIFDASNATSPTGSAINSVNPAGVWQEGYPTLMGWNGTSTFGARVDSCRAAGNGIKAWVRVDAYGTIYASSGVSSVTDHGVGDSTVNFTAAFEDANFAAVGMASSMVITSVLSVATTSVRIATTLSGGGYDTEINLIVMR